MRINVIKMALMEVKKMCNERIGCEECPFTKESGKWCFFDNHEDASATLPFEWRLDELEIEG